MSPVSSSRPPRRRAMMARQASTPIADGDDGGDGRRAQRRPDRAERIDAGADPGADLGSSEGAPRGQRVAAVAAAQRALDEGHERGDGDRRLCATATDGDQDAARPRRRGRRRRASGRRARARLWRRCSPRRPGDGHADRDELQHGQRRCRADVADLRRLAPDLHLERRRAGVAEHADHAERGEREHEDDRPGGEDGRAQQRQRDLAERPPRRRAERGRGGLEVRREVVPHGADGAHDDGQVEDDVGQQDRRRRRVPSRRAAGPARRRPSRPSAGRTPPRAGR